MSVSEPLWAHSPAIGSARWHGLEDHLRATAELARRFALPFGGGDVAYWLGALHDVGKAGCAWQDKLKTVAGTDQRVGIDHKALGTRIAFERGLGGFAAAIYGHHGGLTDVPALSKDLNGRLAKHRDTAMSAESALPRLLPDLPTGLAGLVPQTWRDDALAGEMALRLCYSALVDADSLDTSAHFLGLATAQVREDADFGRLYKLFEQRRGEMLSGRSAAPVDALREQVYAECVAAAELPSGVFRLGAPTGAGKTLASAGFALRHAERYRKRRVIVAVPFLTITEQNAAVYRRMLDQPGAEPVVLEHHSQANFDDVHMRRWARLAAENWDAPFVVTTFVRLFESLYGRKPSTMRRVHRLADSVIVLDEVQALPHQMLAPILDGLRLLVKHFGVTVLLSSATQPSFWALKEFDDDEVPHYDLVQDTPKLVNDLRRVRFEWQVDPQPTLGEIAEQAAACRAALVVVNTTADAKTVFDHWRGSDLEGVAWHLSTRICPDHRQRVLKDVRARLHDGDRVLLVSTQLVEAGVDVDFPVVFRALAPADSLLQAAGRANREGRLDAGRVVIFAPADGGHPPTYKTLIDCTRRHFGPGKAEPDDPFVLPRYYRDLYDALNLADAQHIGQRIQNARRRWEFQTVAEGPLYDHEGHRDGRLRFRMIDDEGISVVTPQAALAPQRRRELEDLIEQLRHAAVPDLAKLRVLQPYTTNVHPSVLRVGGVSAFMQPIIGSEIKRGALVEWRGDYDPHTGIVFDPNLEAFIL